MFIVFFPQKPREVFSSSASRNVIKFGLKFTIIALQQTAENKKKAGNTDNQEMKAYKP